MSIYCFQFSELDLVKKADGAQSSGTNIKAWHEFPNFVCCDNDVGGDASTKDLVNKIPNPYICALFSFSLFKIAHTIKMPTPGYVFRDSGTTPTAEEESETVRRRLGYGDQQQSNVASTQSPQSITSSQSQQSTLHDKPSDSHALAVADHDLKGAAQEAGRSADISDLGWRSQPKDVDALVGGLPNEELWTLIRRFDKVRK